MAALEERKKSRYVPALDGLRAFAVLAVIFYHMGLNWAPGGLMGVTVFFVISGYLINGLLVAEHERTGRISLKGFWMRRVRRLLPAILLSVVGIAALCTLFNPVLLDKMRPDIVPSLLFYNNWWQIFRNVSYFEAAGSPSPLTHFWSLSIEEQFYVVWPLLLLLLYRLGARKQTIGRVALVLAVASGVAMALLYDPQGDPSRVYYGTDTRAMSLLLGVWLSIAWPSAAFDERAAEANRPSLGLNLAGIAACAGLVVVIVATNGFSNFPYYSGIALTSVLSALMIIVLVVPGTWLAKLFGLRPIAWIGKISYSMYLWHFPIILLTTDVNSATATPWWMHAIQLVLTIAAAALSYYFVEDPIRKGKLSEWLTRRKAGHAKPAESNATAQPSDAKTVAIPRAEDESAQDSSKASERKRKGARLPARFVIPAACFVVLLGIAALGVLGYEPTNYAAQFAGSAQTAASQNSDSKEEDADQGKPASAAKSEDKTEDTDESASNSKAEDSSDSADKKADEKDAESAEESDKEASSASASTAKSGTDDVSEREDASESNAAKKDGEAAKSGSKKTESDGPTFDEVFSAPHTNAQGTTVYEPLLIGDSVSLGAAEEFSRVFPYGHLDSVVSRNIWESPYNQYNDAGQVGDYVVFCLGTNNAVQDWQIDDELLANVSEDKKVFMVNTRHNQEWMDATNAVIARTPERHKNVVVVDWYGASEGHSEYFGGDGTHLTEEGARAYIALIKSAIEEDLASGE